MTHPSRAQEIVEYAAIAAVWWALRPFPTRTRWRLVGGAGRRVGPWLWFVRRADAALRETLPDLDAEARGAVIRGMCENFARAVVEVDRLPSFWAAAPDWRVEGLEHLRAARQAGQGRLVIATGHFGNWEAVRAVAAGEGASAGLIYRAFNNRMLDAWAARVIGSTGQPVFHKGRAGARALLRHVAGGGGAMILVDQRMGGAPILDFMGRPAETSLAAAQLALRTDAPLITACARRVGESFEVRFEPAVPVGAPDAMMQTVNDRIGAWVREDPAQWFWLHRRWRVRRQTQTRKRSAAPTPDGAVLQ